MLEFWPCPGNDSDLPVPLPSFRPLVTTRIVTVDPGRAPGQARRRGRVGGPPLRHALCPASWRQNPSSGPAQMNLRRVVRTESPFQQTVRIRYSLSRCSPPPGSTHHWQTRTRAGRLGAPALKPTGIIADPLAVRALAQSIMYFISSFFIAGTGRARGITACRVLWIAIIMMMTRPG